MNQNGSVIVQCPLKNERAWNIWWPARPITSKKSKSLHFSTQFYPHPTTRSYLVGLLAGLCRKILLRLLWNLTKGQKHKPPWQKALVWWFWNLQNVKECKTMQMNVNDVRSRMFIYAQNISKHLKKNQKISKQFMNQSGSVIVQCPLKNERAWNIWWPARPITSKKSKSLHFSTQFYPHPTTRSYLACISSFVGMLVGLCRKILLRLLWNLTKGQKHKPPWQKALVWWFWNVQHV